MRPIDADAALKALRKCQTYLYDARDPELKIELSSAEAAINNLPTIQPVATDICVGDTISRQALCEYALNQKDKSVSPNDIMRFPSAQPEPHEGHWIPVHPIQSDDPGAYMCSKCKTGMWEIRPSSYHYCPNCGAKMKGAKHETD